MEAVFALQEGVLSATNGYAGGETPNPTYEQVSSGATGHAEVVEIKYDPSIVALSEILRTFFSMHDPTTLNRQGNDVGTQYRSAVYWTDDRQKQTIENYVSHIQSDYTKPIVTEIKKLDAFYPAEDYHQEYFKKNPRQAYCQLVIAPKVRKMKKGKYS